MDVKARAERPVGVDVQARSANRAADAAIADNDIRSRLQQVTLRQQAFERSVARDLAVDAAGLAAMDHLMTSGSATPTELAHQLEISTAAMTLVLNRLEAAGHVSREQHPSDRRKVVVTASESSTHEASERVLPLITGVSELVDDLSERDRAVVNDFLAKLVRIYDGAIGATRG